MFSRTLFKKATQATSQQSLFRQPQRLYQTFTKHYMTGFDRMLMDKLSFLKVNGYWFALFGVCNALAYGASLIMDSEWYRYHFAYKTYPARMFKPLKSMMGSDVLANVSWTAPTLIALNVYMHRKVGSLVMTKFFFLSLFFCFAFLSGAPPDSSLNFRPLARILPKIDAYADDGSYYMGADPMAQALICFTLMFHK